MVVQYKGSSLVFKASSQYAVEKIRSFLESKLNTKLEPYIHRTLHSISRKIVSDIFPDSLCIGTRFLFLHPLRYENHTFFDPLSYIDILTPFK